MNNQKKYKYRKKIQLITLIFITILLSSCDLGLQIPKSLSDARFNGDYTYSYYWIASDGLNEDYEYTSLDFDGSNKVFYYSSWYRYRTYSGWSYSGDYIGDAYSWYLEFEVQNGQYRTKLWNNSYSEWDNWENYEFRDNGNTLILYNYYNIEDNNLVLTKN